MMPTAHFAIATHLRYNPQKRHRRRPFDPPTNPSKSQGRYQSKLRIAKSLYQHGYSRQDILALFRLIDWIIALPDRIEVTVRGENK
jgi:hypothetical protein